MNGIIVVNKEKNMTSRDVVNIISKIFNTKKVGHTGTLDPLATGVLVICIGKSTKLVELLTSTYKEYEAEITLGLQTDTLDITGNILKEEPSKISKENIINILNSMEGTYNQEVPIYSAVKINGKKLYDYARNNIEIELPKREVTIKKIELVSDIKYEDNRTIFKIKCLVSKGTYIRSLVRDIAEKLNTIGVMSELNRTKQGKFNIENSCKISDIKDGDYELISETKALDDMFIQKVDESLENKLKNGQLLDNLYNHNIIAFTNSNNELIAIYKTYEKDKSKIKPWKMF